MKKFCRFLYKAAGYIAGFLLACMMVILLVQVFRRRVLGNSLRWAEEAVRFMEIWLVSLGASLCVVDDSHPTVTVFFDLFPAPAKKIVKYIVYALVIFVGICIIRSGILLCMKTYLQRSPTMRISYAWVYAGIPFSGLLIVIQSLGILLKLFKGEAVKDT